MGSNHRCTSSTTTVCVLLEESCGDLQPGHQSNYNMLMCKVVRNTIVGLFFCCGRSVAQQQKKVWQKTSLK